MTPKRSPQDDHVDTQGDSQQSHFCNLTNTNGIRSAPIRPPPVHKASSSWLSETKRVVGGQVHYLTQAARALATRLRAKHNERLHRLYPQSLQVNRKR